MPFWNVLFLSCFLPTQDTSNLKTEIYYPEIGWVDAPTSYPFMLTQKVDNFTYLFTIFNIAGKANLTVFENGKLVVKGFYDGGDKLLLNNTGVEDPVTGIVYPYYHKYYVPSKDSTWNYYHYVPRNQ